MVLSDFLSRQNHNDSNPHEIMTNSFNMYQVLHKNYYNRGNTEKLFSTDTIPNEI